MVIHMQQAVQATESRKATVARDTDIQQAVTEVQADMVIQQADLVVTAALAVREEATDLAVLREDRATVVQADTDIQQAALAVLEDHLWVQA